MANKKIIGSLNYLVVMLAIKFVENGYALEDKQCDNLSFKEKLKHFNQNNDFGFNKISLFPFLLTIANGKKKSLLNHFTEDSNYYFKPTDLGIINLGVNKELTSNQTLVFSTNRYSSEIKLDAIISSSEIEFKSEIISTFFDDLDTDGIIDKIEHSIKFLHDNRIAYFANKTLESLSFLSKNNLVYKLFSYERTRETLEPNEINNFKRIVEAETYNLGETATI